jgi:hypothetical protein
VEAPNVIKKKFHTSQRCSKCIYLGSEIIEYYEANRFDYYFCIGYDKTLIARHGEGGEYYSGTVFAFDKNPDLYIYPLRRAAMLSMRYPEIVEMMGKEIKSYPDKYQDFLQMKKELL